MTTRKAGSTNVVGVARLRIGRLRPIDDKPVRLAPDKQSEEVFMNFFKHFWHISATDYRTEGEAFLAHGDYNEAITDFDKAILLQGGHHEVSHESLAL